MALDQNLFQRKADAQEVVNQIVIRIKENSSHSRMGVINESRTKTEYY